MSIGFVGTKIGMTQIFDETGDIIPVTVVKAEPNQILGIRTQEKNGYTAVQVGVGEKKKNRTTKPEAGQYAKIKETTGVEASTDSRGHLVLTSRDGRAIQLTASGVIGSSSTNMNQMIGIGGSTTSNSDFNGGRLTLTRVGAADIIVSGGVGTSVTQALNGSAQATSNLRDIGGPISADMASAMGFNANGNIANIGTQRGAGVTTLKGAMAVMKIADAAIQRLDQVRADMGSVQNQLTSIVNNISVTQVNVKSAESQIRDVDFAEESANFSKYNILAQSGSYAMSQANAVQQNVLKLLQ